MLSGFQVRLDGLLQVTGFSVQPVNWTGDAPCMRVEARGCLPGVFRCYYSESQYGDQCFYRLVNCRIPCYRAAVGYTLPKLRAPQGSNLCEANSRKHQW